MQERKQARNVSMRNKNTKKRKAEKHKECSGQIKPAMEKRKQMLKGKQKKLPEGLKKKILASMLDRKKKKKAVRKHWVQVLG